MVEVAVDAYHHSLLAGDVFGHLLVVLEVVLPYESFFNIHHGMTHTAFGKYDVASVATLALDDAGKQAYAVYLQPALGAGLGYNSLCSLKVLCWHICSGLGVREGADARGARYRH